MTFRVVITPRGQSDFRQIYEWIDERSPSGAVAWLREWQRSLESLSENPLQYGVAPENEFVAEEIRQIVFRTRRGNSYRALFFVDATTVHILHVRGPGQAPLKADDLDQP